MTKHDEARRAFLLGAGAAAGAVLAPEAKAQTLAQNNTAAAAPMDHAHAGGSGHGAFLNDDNSATIAAFTERLMPGAPGKPGALDAGVLNYIDLAIAVAYEDLQDFYTVAASRRSTPTAARPTTRRSRSLAPPSRTKSSPRSKTARPRNSPGRRRKRSSTPSAPTPWKACSPTRSMAATRTSPAGSWSGFPGAQPAFTPEDMQSREAFTRVGMIGLQAQAKR